MRWQVYGTDIIISEAVNKKLPEECMSRRLATVTVPGKTTQLNIYQLSYKDEALTDVYSLYEQALHNLEMYDLVNARQRIREALKIRPTDAPSLRLLKRIEESPEEQPAGWTSIETLVKG